VTAEISKTPVAVDYTGRDYSSLRSALIQRIQDRVPTWKGNDPADFGVALVEAFAYMGDTVAYYIDRIANESSLLTATQRSSVFNIAKSYGYTPAGYTAASCSVTLKLPAGALSSVVVPAGTTFTKTVSINGSYVPLYFYTTTDVTVTTSVSATVTVTEGLSNTYANPASSTPGDVAGVQAATGTGEANQQVTLTSSNVIDNSVTVYVENYTSGTTVTNYGKWTQVTHLADYGPNDSVFTVDLSSDNVTTIIFGDGVSGAVPAKNKKIKVQYKDGNGALGNVSGGTLDNASWYNLSALDPISTVVITQTGDATGGNDPESTDHVRANAPLAFTALNRAITLNDYSGLVLQKTSVGKANAVASSPNSVTVYVAPNTKSDPLNPYPLYDSTNSTLNSAQWTSLKSDALSALNGKTVIGAQYSVVPPTYIPVTLSIKYVVDPQYYSNQVNANIKALIMSYYSYPYVSFQQTIHPEELEALIRYAPGALNAQVTALYTGSNPGRNTLIGNANEIFIFTEANITVDKLISDTQLTNVVVVGSSETLSPAFNAGITNYLVTSPTPTGNSGLSVTGIARSANSQTATITTSASHGFTANHVIQITGLTASNNHDNTEFNGVWVVASGSGSTLTITTPSPKTPAVAVAETGLTGSTIQSVVALTLTGKTAGQTIVASTSSSSQNLGSSGTYALPVTTTGLTAGYTTTVKVTAEDGVTSQNYTFNITKA
jgi:hypothetical protein